MRIDFLMEAYKIEKSFGGFEKDTTIYVPGRFVINRICDDDFKTSYCFTDDSDNGYAKHFQEIKNANKLPKTPCNPHYQISKIDLADSLVLELKETGERYGTAQTEYVSAKDIFKKTRASLETIVRKSGCI